MSAEVQKIPATLVTEQEPQEPQELQARQEPQASHALAIEAEARDIPAERKLKIIGGRDASNVAASEAAERKITSYLIMQWERQVLRVAGDIASYGFQSSGETNERMNRLFTDKAAEFDEEQLEIMANSRTPDVAASVNLVRVWRDQMFYRDHVEAAEAKGQMDLGAIEAHGLMLAKARQAMFLLPQRH